MVLDLLTLVEGEIQPQVRNVFCRKDESDHGGVVWGARLLIQIVTLGDLGVNGSGCDGNQSANWEILH